MINSFVVCFVDLDDTLFQSYRKCDAIENKLLAAQGSTKERSSFMNDHQLNLLKMLNQNALVIPTTARDKESFSNVKINWAGPAILNHGGTILNDEGAEDLDWKAKIDQEMNGIPEMLASFESIIGQRATEENLDVRIKIVGVSPLYLVIKHNQSDITELSRLKEYIENTVLSLIPGEFYIHFNDNNLAVIPSCLNKSHAVKYMMDHYFPVFPVTTFGVGDSLSDIEYMSLCDFAITPKHSQIMQKLKEV